MAVYKNKASQKAAVFAYDPTTGDPVTGDAANITAQISKDGAATAATNDVNPAELDSTDAPGIYLFDLTQAETNADLIVIVPVSSTADVLLEPLIIYTEPEQRTADVTAIGGDSQSATDLKDFVDAGYDPSTNKVQGVVLVDTVTTLTGHTAQTGDSYPIVSSGTHGNAAIKTETAEIKAKTDNLPDDPADASVIAASFTVIAQYIDTEISTIISELAKVPKSDGVVSWNATALAAIQTQAAAALTAYDGPTNAEMEARTLAAADYATEANVNLRLLTSAYTTPPTANENADALLIRSVTNVQDTAGEHTLCSIILATLESSRSGTTWTIRKTGGTTYLTKTLTVDAAATPITGVT